MKNKNYSICVNCIMDSSDLGISFDKNGHCDYCQNFNSIINPSWDTGEKGKEKLFQLADKIRKEGKGKDFDCIIGISMSSKNLSNIPVR